MFNLKSKFFFLKWVRVRWVPSSPYIYHSADIMQNVIIAVKKKSMLVRERASDHFKIKRRNKVMECKTGDV